MSLRQDEAVRRLHEFMECNHHRVDGRQIAADMTDATVIMHLQQALTRLPEIGFDQSIVHPKTSDGPLGREPVPFAPQMWGVQVHCCEHAENAST